MYRTALTAVAFAFSLSSIGLTNRPISAQMMAKAQVANLIANVENGVDEFRNYLEKRGDKARDASTTAQTSARKKRQATESQTATCLECLSTFRNRYLQTRSRDRLAIATAIGHRRDLAVEGANDIGTAYFRITYRRLQEIVSVLAARG